MSLKMNKKDKIVYLIHLGAILEQQRKLERETIVSLFKVRRMASKHHLLCEYFCNGRKANGQEYQEDEFYRDTDKLEGKIKTLLNSVGLFVEFQSDPRGATVKISTANDFYSGGNLTSFLEV